eukprot:7343909-Heterocapsa_arctica.AAC.1
MRMKSHLWHGSYADLWAGGCILGISRQFADALCVEHATILPGRIHRMSISTDEGSLHVLRVPSWTTTQFRAAIKAISNHLAEFMHDLIIIKTVATSPSIP